MQTQISAVATADDEKNDDDDCNYVNIFSVAPFAAPDDPPELREAFRQQTLDPGPDVSLKCIASGHPLPQITWTLDDFAIPERQRVRFGDYVTNVSIATAATETFSVACVCTYQHQIKF